MKFLEHLEGLVSSKIEAAKGIYTLFKLESQLASLNIFALIGNSALLIATVFGAWLSGMCLLGYGISLVLGGSYGGSLASILILNLMVLLLVFKRIKTNLKNISFEKTRASLFAHDEEIINEPTSLVKTNPTTANASPGGSASI